MNNISKHCSFSNFPIVSYSVNNLCQSVIKTESIYSNINEFLSSGYSLVDGRKMYSIHTPEI